MNKKMVIILSVVVLVGLIIFGLNSFKSPTDEKDVTKAMKPEATQTSKKSVEKQVESKPNEKSQAEKDAEAIKKQVDDSAANELEKKLNATVPTETTTFKPNFPVAKLKTKHTKPRIEFFVLLLFKLILEKKYLRGFLIMKKPIESTMLGRKS